jgi:glycosyltransferase involved in cell wall biosynthesis
MATYNGAQYLQAQLQSFQDQTRKPDELIISDDCSTDETETIVREFAINASFKVEFHRNEKNLGYCGNFNSALMKTTGDIVFLSDQDDVWLPEKLETIENVFSINQNVNVVLNDAWITDEFLNRFVETKLQKVRRLQDGDLSFVTGCCMALRKDFLKTIVPIQSQIKEHDRWIAYLAEINGSKLIIEEKLQLFRRHSSNTSNSVTSQINKTKVWAKIISKIKNPDSTVIRYQYLETFFYELEFFTKKNSIFVSNNGQRLIYKLRRELCFARWHADVRSSPRHLRVFKVFGEVLKKEHNLGYGFVNALYDCIVATEK